MAMLSDPRACFGFVFFCLLLTKSFGDTIDDLIQFEEDLNDNKPDDDNPFRDDDLKDDNPVKEEESVIHLWQLKKTKWRTSLQPYDVNKDGKLSGLELISAYPEIERLIKTEDEESNWLNLIGIQNIGVVVAIVIGGAVLIYAIKALTAPSQQQLVDREKQFSSEKERWLNKLQGTQKHNEHVTDQGSNTHIDKPTAEKISTEKFDVNVSPESSKESSPKLRKRKPDAGRDLVTNKMARYQHLTAVRRQTANRSDNNSAGFCQQLLSDEDEIAENSSDEIVGNTRKRRQIDKVKVDVIEQKVANVSINGDTLCDSKSQNGGITTDKSVNKNAKKPVRNNKSSLVNAENYELLLDKNTEEKTLNAETVPVQLSREVRNETIMKIISFVLGCSTSVEDVTTINFKSQQKILRFSLLHLPAQRDNVAEKIQAIVKVVTVRQIDKVKYAVTCFDRSSEKLVEQMDSVTEEVCEFLIGYFIEIIVKEVNSVQDDEEEDELWKDFNSVFISKSSVQALTRIAGWVDDGIVISQHLLSRLLQHQDGAKFVRNLFHGAGKQLMSVKRIDEVIIEEGRILRALEILLSNANCGRLIGEIMEEEVKEASGSLGNFFEKSSIFGPLLSLTTVPMKEDKNLKQKSPRAQPFLELKGFPRPALSDIRFLESNIQGALQRCQNIVHKALMTVLKSKSTRESGLAWLASVINLNDIRTTWSPEPDSQLSIGCCDGYMLNFCPVLLELFMPAINSGDLLSRVDLDYSSSESCRLNFDFEICLAGGQIVSENSEERKIGKLSEAQQGKFNFLTESFHLCQRGLSVGVLPAMSHRNAQLRHLGQVLQQLKETTREEEIRKLQALISLMWEVSLIDPVLVRKMSQFYLCQAQLLLNLIESSEQGVDCIKLQKKLLSRIPEFCIKDMCVWFRLVAQYATYLHSDVLAGLSLAPFVDCCVALLSEQELMPGPVAASKVVSSLLSFVNSSSGRNDRNTGWGNGAKSSLAMMVFTCPSFMEKLGPALIRTYVNVDVVEGLDVDKDEFDKYTSRAEITLLVQELWDRFDSRTSILKLVGTKLFQNFLGSVLNTLLYMLHDALTRVANIRKMEQAKDNVEEWQRLSLRERTEKDMFLKREEEAAKVFMKSANNTLDFVEFLTKTEIVATCFTRQPLSHRAANAILGFLDSLCGAKSMDYKVKDEQKYNFDHCVLLNKIVSVILNIAEQDTSKTEGFVFSMATDDDFSPPTLEKALSVITRKFLAGEDSLESFSKLIQAMKEIQLPKGSSRDGDLKGDNCKRWQEQITSLTVDTEALGEAYKTELTNLRFDSSEIQESHSFHGNVQDISPGPSKIKTLMKEMKQLSSNLPVHPNAAIFVRQDEERIDLMRAMVTGPVDTPYSLGCFIFDIFFPNNYPNIPPLVKIITTGNGTVRFNPNLYSDGKVCLSLLGTWHAGDASEKWIPSKSSLYQVLVSIQSLILIPDPMFNEPGYEGLRSTAEGMGRSKAYNSKLRLWTVRHAMLGQLRSPPAGFEVLIRKHFKLQKNVVLKQCSSWLNDCEDPEEEKRLRSVVNDLREELSKLDECPGKKIAESELQEELAKSEDLKKTEASETCQLFEDDLSDDALYG